MTRPRDVIRKMQKRITALEGEFREKDAEIRRLREALMEIANHIELVGGVMASYSVVRGITRKALSKSKGDNE